MGRLDTAQEEEQGSGSRNQRLCIQWDEDLVGKQVERDMRTQSSTSLEPRKRQEQASVDCFNEGKMPQAYE